MRRVVVTGMGIVSCLGNSLDQVGEALRTGRPGIRFEPSFAEHDLRSQVAGVPDVNAEPPIDRKVRRFMGDAAQYAWWAMRKATDDARLPASVLTHPRTGLIAGSGVGSNREFLTAVDTARQRGTRKVPPYTVPRVMGNTVSACLSTAFGIRGMSYSITAACTTSTHCIGDAIEPIRSGRQDVVFAGGAEELFWGSAMCFDAMGVLSTGFNDRPHEASRPFDVKRDGFVIAGGAGMLVLESLEHARNRGARIYAELVGYGATSDGTDMVKPEPDGAARAMQLALTQVGTAVDYINAHATSTPAGDIAELEAIGRVFGDRIPPLSSTKGLTGHPIGAAGVHEAIYTLLMLDQGFIAGCATTERPDPMTAGFPLVLKTRPERLNCAMTNNFGFGGTNASLVFRRIDG